MALLRGSSGRGGSEDADLDGAARRFFGRVVRWRVAILVAGALAVASSALLLPRLTKDTSAEAYMPAEHPAVQRRDHVREVFGLWDPIVVAVVRDEPGGIFNPGTLALLRWITERIAEIPGIDPERVVSLSNQNNIVGTRDGLMVEPFYESVPSSEADLNRLRRAALQRGPQLGTLVSRDGSAALIVAELLDRDRAQEAYQAILELVGEAPADGEVLYVAGEGASTAYLGSYIDADARRLNPIALGVVLVMLFVAYGTLRGVLLPVLIVAASVTIALGSMAAVGVPYYTVTSALSVILIGIGVCDGIHILGQYYEEVALRPDAGPRSLAVDTMVAMWRPVTITSLTSVAGFAGLSAVSFMPPLRAFGAFAAIGVLAALLFSLLVLPAVLALLPPKPSRAFRRRNGGATVSVDRFGSAASALGGFVASRPLTVLLLWAGVVAIGVAAASRVRLDDDRLSYFQPGDAIRRADRAINTEFDGTYYLDVVVETTQEEGLFDPDVLERIDELQAFLETLPHVGGSHSIVEYIKQMNMAVHAGDSAEFRIPDDPNVIAQYFLLYSASGGPTDFEKEIDSEYRQANVRVGLREGRWSAFAEVLRPARRYIREQFGDTDATVSLSGTVNLSHQRAVELARSHPLGVALAFVAVFLTVALSFRSAGLAQLALIPVAVAVLTIYAAMGGAGILLGTATSMSAAIAIGLSVDFAVHTLDRLIVLVKQQGLLLERAYLLLFASTGRALMFSFASIALGFGVLTASRAPSLRHFGLLVAVCVSAGFAASLTLLPACLRLLGPGVFSKERRNSR